MGSATGPDVADEAKADGGAFHPADSPGRREPVVFISGNRHQGLYLRDPGTDLDVIVNGPCAVEVRAGGAGGVLLYQDDLDAGDTVELPSNVAVWLRLSDPNAVTIQAGGTAVPIATLAGPAPYELLFDFAEQ